MYTIASSGTDLDRQRADEVVRGVTLPRAVTGYDIEFGENWAGEPAVFVHLYVPLGTGVDAFQPGEITATRFELFDAFVQAFPSLMPTIDLRTRPTQPAG